MAKEELGTKRVCPETGKRFYDLGKDPIISPYTGKEYPLTFFEGTPETAPVKEEKQKETVSPVSDEVEDTVVDDEPEIISLEDAEDDDDDTVDGEDIPDIPDVDIDVDDDDSEDDDTFLEDDDEDDDLSDVLGGSVSSDEDEV